MKHFTRLIFTTITLGFGLGLFASDPLLRDGFYSIQLHINDSISLPVRLKTSTISGKKQYTIINDTEQIALESNQKQDSLFLYFPVFNSNLSCHIISDTSFNGLWNNLHKGPTYKIPIQGSLMPISQIDTPKTRSLGNWECTFSKGVVDSSKAIASLNLTYPNILTGTFLTETGDYRFLQGELIGSNFYLSCLDGSHAFYFTGTLNQDSSISNGMFYSGTHWSEPWIAIKNETFALRDPNKLTYLNPGYKTLSFSFPDLEGQPVSLSDAKYHGKVIIVQLMGSWCPNCLDESIYFNSLYNTYHKKGLEIIALAYEAKDDFNYASTRVKTLKSKLNASYTFLIAGTSNKTKAQLTLPMLNHVMSFPTSIIIDKKGNVRNIYTGFYGPGTGIHYAKYTEETERLIETLLAE